METEATVNLNAEGVVPPRGDLVKEIKALVEEQSRPQIVGVNDPMTGVTAPVILRRNNEGEETVENVPIYLFSDYLDGPRRRSGQAILTSLDSFIAHANRFKDEESAIFAKDDRANPSLTAVLNYHGKNVPIEKDGETQIGIPPARFGDHRSYFAFPLSDEWKAWNAGNGVKMSVATFAEFLEDRIADICEPGEHGLSDAQEAFIKRLGGKDRIATVSDLVTLSKGLRVYENGSFTNAANLSSGEGEVVARVEHADANGTPLLIPTTFQIAIPVFRNDDFYVVVARLRYRVNGGAMTLTYDLWGVEKVFDHAFTTAAEKAAEATGLPLFLGAPE